MSRWFPNGCVASPHHLASSAGHAVLASGGNAIDAAVAANLVLSVVTPYYCGVGGDLLAIVWDGQANGVQSVGAAPSGASPEAVHEAIAAGHGDAESSFPGTNGMPTIGALPVTVPGAAAGWAHLLERWGSRSFGDLVRPAHHLAVAGFPVSAHAARFPERARARFATEPGWDEHYGQMREGERFVQRDLAATLTALAEDGPDALYRGHLGAAIAEELQRRGSTMAEGDLAAHAVEEVVPLRGDYRDVEVLELPPPTQGLTALTALGILDALGPLPSDASAAAHLQVEAIRAAMADRQDHLADPRTMRVTPEVLLDKARLGAIADSIDAERATDWPPVRPAPGGTAYLCAADRDGLMVSLIQSNFAGFGSGVVVPGTGIGLHNRGAHFSLDPADPNVIAPGKRPMHTLIPALVLRGGQPWLVMGTMGGDGQPQIHTQLLGHLVDRGGDVQDAIDHPRWIVDPADGSLKIESRATDLAGSLTERGHQVSFMEAFDHGAGHAHAIEVTAAGYRAGSDPRAEGAVVGG